MLRRLLCKTVLVLDRIQARGFKSLHDVELRLAPLVVVFGPNAVGKSNLLEALMLLGRLVTERVCSTLAWNRRTGDSAVTSTALTARRAS